MAHKISDFLNDMDLSDIGEKKIHNFSPSKRIPIFLLIDNSASMSIVEEKMSNTVNRVISTLYKHKEVQIGADVYLLTFNDRVTILNDRCPITKNYKLNIDYHGPSFLGLALKSVLDFIETIKSHYKQSTPAIKYYTPLLLFFSDGYTYSNSIDQELYISSITRIKKEVSANFLNVFSFALGEEYDYNNLCDITGLSNSSHIIIVENGGKWFDDFEDFLILPE